MTEILTIEKYTWGEIRDEVIPVAPVLASVIDAFDPSPAYFFMKAYYPYGSQLLNRGLLHLPVSDRSCIPIEHALFPSRIRDALNYSSIPLGLILKNSCEVYFEKDYHIESLAFFNPGIILGLWETLEPSISHFPRKIWRISAGARSLFMLPKIADAMAYERLKKRYHLRYPMPKRLFDHALIFSEIVKNSLWRQEVLYFSKKWIEENSNKGWIQFKRYLLEEAWKLSSYNRNEATRTIVWSLFTYYLLDKGVKPKSHLMQLLKRLVSVSLGGIPGYQPAGLSTHAAPIHEIQEAYIQDYAISYAPILMQPCQFQLTEASEPVYYSLNLPSLIDMEINYHTGNTLLTELKTLKSMWGYFVDAALDGKLHIDDTPLQAIINNIKLEFFHNEKDKYGDVDISAHIPLQDANMLKMPMVNNTLPFPASSTFLRACVRISRIL